MCSKLSTGGGEETCHSRPRAFHGFCGARLRQMTVDQTKLKMKMHSEAPRQNAEIDTQSFSVCRLAAYSKTRRGWPSTPTANSGMNVQLNAMNIVQKWNLPSRSFMRDPHDLRQPVVDAAEEREDQAAHDRVVEVRHHEEAAVRGGVGGHVGQEHARDAAEQEVDEERRSRTASAPSAGSSPARGCPSPPGR